MTQNSTPLKISQKLLLIFSFLTVLIAVNAENTENLLAKLNSLDQESQKIDYAETCNKLGYNFWELQNHEKAIEYFEKSLTLNQQINNNNAVMHIYTNLGLIYSDIGQYETSLLNFRKSLKLRENFNEKSLIATELINISVVLQKLKRYFESNTNAEDAIKIAQSINNFKIIRRCYGILYENYKSLGDAQKSMEYFNLYATFEKHIQKEEMKQMESESKKKVDQISIIAKQAEKEKQKTKEELLKKEQKLRKSEEISTLQQQEIKKKQLELTVKDELINQKNKTLIIFFSGLIVVFVLLIYIFISFKQKQKINKTLETQNSQILQHQEEIKKKSLNITKSINYASRIQSAMMQPQQRLQQFLPDSFIFFKPRDIVSGDFYWFEPINLKSYIIEQIESENLYIGDLLITAADCTGHGVPGAFMSMIGIKQLDEILKSGETAPHMILDELHQGVSKALKQDITDNDDGMDMALCKIMRKEKKLEFAGAKNPMIYFQKGVMHEIKGDHYPVGGLKYKGRKPFTKHQISIEYPTTCYIYSDGFQDQFGGSDGRKFMTKKFKQLLAEIHTKPMYEQHTILERTLYDWKGSNKQVDDIIIIGFKI